MRTDQPLSDFSKRVLAELDAFLLFVPMEAADRAEADWWREFIAFVAMRQNFPAVPVTLSDERERS